MADIPLGELVTSTIAMPKDTNVYGDIFGGWLVSQMDLGGAQLAHRAANARVTTVAIENLEFLLPVKVGDVVQCYAKVVSTGKSSIRIKVQVIASRFHGAKCELVTKGEFVFVAIDETGKPNKNTKWYV